LIWHNVGRRRLILPVLLGLWLYRSGDRLVLAASEIWAVFRGPPYFPRRRTAPRYFPTRPSWPGLCTQSYLRAPLASPAYAGLDLSVLIRRILFLDEIR
jgi:hypothetical protein